MNNNLNLDEIKELQGEIPLKRMGSSKEVANVVKMLINNQYITGQVITVDGGWIN